MLVEFIGLPGSGKTTYLEVRTKDLSKDKVLTRLDLKKEQLNIAAFVLYLFRNFSLFFYFKIGVLYNIDFNLKRWYALMKGVVGTLQDFAKIDRILREDKNRIIVLDEGLLQRSLSVFCFFDRKANPFLFKRILRVIKRSKIIDEIDYIKVNLQTSIDRCQKRDSGFPFRFRSLKEKVIFVKFNNQLKGVKLIETEFQLNTIMND